MRPSCDEAVVRSGGSVSPCKPESRKWVLAVTILGSSMAFIDSTVVNVALPALQSSLHATVVDVQWVVESYGLFLSALILVGGALGDSIGRRKMFLAGVAVFAAASLGCGLSSSITMLVSCRCIQGIGAAFLVPGSLSIISASFDEQSRGRAIGIWSGFTAITTALGPVLGGFLIEHASWHWAFLINLPLAFVVIAISLRHVTESRSSRAQKVDWTGAAIATIGLAALVYGFLESGKLGFHDLRVVGSLIGGFASVVVFLYVQKRVTSPMVPLRLFESPSFSGANLLTLFLYSALGIFFFLFPLNLIQIQAYSATATGAAALPLILLMFFLSGWSGGLVGRYGAKLPLIIGPLIAAAGFLLFAVPSVGANYWTSYFPAFVVLGFGMAISVAPLTTVVMTSVEQDHAGTASGINNAVARVAGVLAIAVFGVVMVKVFAHSLERSLGTLHLDPQIAGRIRSNTDQLGALGTTSFPNANNAAAVKSAISEAFILGFRVIVVLCAVLAVASAGMALAMVPRKAAQTSQSGQVSR